MSLIRRFKSGLAKAVVVGGGYAGLPLAIELAKRSFSVVVVDIDVKKVDAINRGHSYLKGTEADLSDMVKSGHLRASTAFEEVVDADSVHLCVPTPVDTNGFPDLSHLKNATRQVGKHLGDGILVVVESTVYPGVTEESVLPILENSSQNEVRRTVGKDFYLAYSPERVNPGSIGHTLRSTPKLVGGVTDVCLRFASSLYNEICSWVIEVNSIRVAEMSKLLENVFRCVNIGLANEMSLLCSKLEIDVHEVIEAASSKPFGFMPFYPGPGVGGHCIPIDSQYLTWLARKVRMPMGIVEASLDMNSDMPLCVTARVESLLREHNIDTKDAKVHVLGVSYKANVDDIRESPALKIIGLLSKEGARVTYTDPYVSVAEVVVSDHRWVAQSVHNRTVDVNIIDEGVDLLLILTNHDVFDYKKLADQAKIVLDTRGCCPKLGNVYIM